MRCGLAAFFLQRQTRCWLTRRPRRMVPPRGGPALLGPGLHVLQAGRQRYPLLLQARTPARCAVLPRKPDWCCLLDAQAHTQPGPAVPAGMPRASRTAAPMRPRARRRRRRSRRSRPSAGTSPLAPPTTAGPSASTSLQVGCRAGPCTARAALLDLVHAHGGSGMVAWPKSA